MADNIKPSQPLRLAVSAREAARMLGIGKSQVFKLLSENSFPNQCD